MIELVVPDSLEDHSRLDDDRLSLTRELVGRLVFGMDGTLDEARAFATHLSEDATEPVLVNDVVSQTEDVRVVDVYVHRNGRPLSVSEGVEQPHPG
jgi:hypothetical protein